jgi:tetratricopeptide (TPR) repeat protein/CHAT domain-containing protein
MNLMKILKLYTLIAIGISLGSYSCAQTGEYAKLESVYNRLYEEDKKDSMLLVARQINGWTRENEGDTSLHYATSFRFIGHAFENSDSALFYYESSLCLLEKQNRKDGIDAAMAYDRVGWLYFNMGNYTEAEQYYLQALDIKIKVLGQGYPDYSADLNDLGILFWEIGEYAKAESYYTEALEIERKTIGEAHPEYASSLFNLGILFSDMGEYAKAEQYYTKALAIRNEVLGDDHLDYAASLNGLGSLYYNMGEYAKSEPYYLQSIEIRKKTLGEDHPDYASGLYNIGLLYLEMEDYEKAELYYLECLEIRRKKLGDEHPDCAATLNGLGNLYLGLGEFSKAERYFLQSSEIYKKIGGAFYTDYAMSLHNFGCLYYQMSLLDKAEVFLLESLEIYKQNLGFRHSYYASNLYDLGFCYKLRGEYANAETYFLNSLEIRLELYGREHPDYADCLNELGSIDWELHDYVGALSKYKAALDIYKRVCGESSPMYAMSLGNLGLVYSDLGEYANAEPYYLQSLEIKKKTLGETHPDYADGLNNLGSLYFEMGEYLKAESYYLQSLEIYKKTLGEAHPDYSLSLNNLGALYFEMGEYLKAEPFYLRSLEIKKKALGENHKDFVLTLNNIGRLYSTMDNLTLFEQSYFSYFPSCQGALRKNASLNSKTKNAYKENYTDQLYPFLCYLSYREDESSQIQLAGFNHWFFLNGWVGDRDALLSREVGAAGDTVLAALYEDYRMQRTQLSKHYELTIDERAKRGIDIEKEEQAAERMESELAVKMEAFKRINAVYDFEDLREQIKSDEAYVDILRVPYYDFKNQTWPDSSFYMAYVVTTDTREAPLLINLGDGKRMEEEVFPYLMGQITKSRSSTMDGAVYHYLWKPLEGSLEGKKLIYLSSGGIYHNFNPETIYHAENGKYLYEEKDIHLVSSGRAFVDQRLYGSQNYTDETALLLGSPDFDATGETDKQETFSSPGMTYATMRDLTRDGTFLANPLPATLQEVESIRTSLTAANWDVELYTGVNAREDQLKKMSSPRILHLATHGFFMEDTEQRAESGMRILGMDRERVAENPLLRSGLLLSGCNKTFKDSSLISGGDNGILTAYEAGLLNLRNTDLVVLSACETGKGEILNGEGVQGLRKAMTDAGAEHILMSLWKVDDKVTSEYMQIFYGHYAQGKSIRESYNLTRNEIKQKYPQLYYWGAFVLVGE